MYMQPNYFYARQPAQQEYYQAPQMPIMQTQPQPQLKGRPVASIDEARAAQIDFDGSLFTFPDVVNKKIYTKQINLDGTVSINTYALVEEVTPSPTFVTKEEFDEVISQLKKMLQKQDIAQF